MYLVYNTVVQCFCCGGKANLVRIFLVESKNFLLVHRNRYLEGMDNGQKTPRGHPDFHSYMKIQRVFLFQTSFWLKLFYSTLLALTHRQKDRRRLKLILVGLGNLWFLQVYFTIIIIMRMIFQQQKNYV
jgi:hypothetical protein